MPRGLHIVEDWAGGMFVLWPALKFVSERIGSWFPAVGSAESGLDPNGAGVTAAGYTDVLSDGLDKMFGMFVLWHVRSSCSWPTALPTAGPRTSAIGAWSRQRVWSFSSMAIPACVVVMVASIVPVGDTPPSNGSIRGRTLVACAATYPDSVVRSGDALL